MSFFQIIKRSLLFFRRTNFGVFLAAAVGTAILTGALLVGSSVRHSLAKLVEDRLGNTQVAIAAGNRFFRSELADDLLEKLDVDTAAVLQLRGLITNNDGSKRTGRVEVLGVDERFFAMGDAPNPFEGDISEGVVINSPLAAKLNVGVGDEVMLRVSKPGLMPRDVPLTPDSDLSIGFRLTVKAIVNEQGFGRFSLQANQVSPFNAFVPLKWLGEKTEHAGQANMVLVGSGEGNEITVETANEAVKKSFKLEDIAIEVRRLPEQGEIEVLSRRIFIDDVLAEVATTAGDKPTGIMTYFVNELRKDPNSTPYSFVTAIDVDQGDGVIPSDLSEDQIVIGEWLANDLNAKEGDKLTLSYFVMGPMRKLKEQSTEFTVRAVVGMTGLAADAQLMPDFPGLADADDCRDWKPGIPIDLDKIHDEDEAYWDMYRGVPKAFVTLSAGQKMWGNRFGKLTAVRYPIKSNKPEDISSKILETVDPATAGMFFQPVRALGDRAGAQGTDFGGLFLGLSMFLIASAVILLGLVFVFGVEKRRGQSGTLLALGFSHKTIKHLFLIEGAIISVCGAVAGVIIAIVYTLAMTISLSTVWKSATGGASIHFYASPASLMTGAVAGVAVSLLAIWLTLRKQLSKSARELLVANVEEEFLSGPVASKSKVSFYVAAASIALAVVILIVGSESGAFFGAGALLLIAVLSLAHGVLRHLASKGSGRLRSVRQLALRNTTRRSGRSLAVIALLAAGCFLIISVGAFRQDSSKDAYERDSGTGGFAFVGESSIPVLHDLSVDGFLQVVQLRVNDGDDASCLNLNRAQRPRLVGVQSGQLQGRGAFGFAEVIAGHDIEEAWELLDLDLGEDVVPAIGDGQMIKWILGKGVGQDIEYSDERGRTFKLRLVGGLKNSVMQGSLVISADQFIKRFPSEAGYRMFLVDADKEETSTVEDVLSKALVDFGLELTPAVTKMQELNAVQNTYLSIFQILGGLGLILGSVGLAIVVLLNVLERTGEFAMLRAVGFSKNKLRKMVLFEHTALVATGLIGGVVSAIVAIIPAAATPGAQLPYKSLCVIIACIAVSAVVWIRIATAIALSGNLLDAIRNE